MVVTDPVLKARIGDYFVEEQRGRARLWRVVGDRDRAGGGASRAQARARRARRSRHHRHPLLRPAAQAAL
ncbi:MAG: hypothetical protein EXQ92_04585 [Alphaproteobacteria bacterium]|nr:hypothetical protein [Alphaproteobacteria bacterium]